MTPDSRKAAETYYREAGSWARERTESLRTSRKISWIVAFAAVTVALAEALALILLVPLKSVVPYTLLVDRQTGYVQALKPIDADRIAPDAALTQSFLVQYVIAREEFDLATVQSNYRKVALWSAEGARQKYLSAMQVTSPDSPLQTVPRGAMIEARVRSVSALSNRTAMVRFETLVKGKGSNFQPPRAWVAIINYQFSNVPMSLEDRFINPLGFQVVAYRRNPETPPAASAAGGTDTALAPQFPEPDRRPLP